MSSQILKDNRVKLKTKSNFTAPMIAAKPVRTPATFKSSEYIQESDIDMDDKLDSESNSDDESLPANPADAAPKVYGKLPPPSGSSSSSEGESENDIESTSSEEEEPTKKPQIVLKPAKKPAKNPTARAVTFEKPPPFKAPSGFEPGSVDETSQASQLFRKSNLQGKQIWYFTAPASVPVSSIKKMSLQDAQNSKAIFSHNDGDYGFVQGSAADMIYTRIMLPNGSDDGYQTSSKAIDQVLHLQRIVALPGVHDSTTNTKATIPAKAPVRPQPKGLRIRFRPIGFGGGNAGEIGSDTESDEETEETNFRKPAAVAAEDSPNDSDNEMTEVLLPVKKSKHKKSSSKEEPSQEKKAKKEKSLKRKHNEGDEKRSKKRKPDRITEKYGRQEISVN